MRLLLFSIAIIYSFIFYIFSNFSNGLDVFGNKLSIGYNISTLSTNLLFETVIFLIIGIFFYIYFMDLSGNKYKKITFNKIKYKKYINNILIIIFSFTLFFLTCYYLNNFINNKALLLNLIGIIFNILFYFIFVNLYFFKKNRLILRKIALLFIYISSTSGIYYLYNFDINYIILSTIFYSILFNLKIHIKYSNYISLIFGLILMIFTTYYLFFY